MDLAQAASNSVGGVGYVQGKGRQWVEASSNALACPRGKNKALA